ncbi:CaiB/BaiF CoA transferase family protein [Brevibacterium sp. VCM10]|uniref:CaiB/BaiF CoA transferase family protein n=1 Tax=Brevibacterium sp. VCM10 TaxID=1381751 RepID=UPI00046E5DC8|nr:CaiB/BaiF CoA-transferase family protein [Brevibacterium sp. VCM10]
MSGSLSGIKVLVLAGMGPVPFISMLLADHGAEVVRVTRPRNRSARALTQTEGLTPERDVVERGIESVEIDLKAPEGRETVLRLAASADVFVEGFRPGVVERLGLGPGEVRARNERIVYARLTGYGQTGPRAKQAGHDINYVAQSGVLSALGRADAAPFPPINLLGDYAAGGAVGAFGVAAALVSAQRTGQGQVLDIAMLDGAALLTAKLHGLRASGLHSDERGTNFLDGGAPFYDTYECADRRYLAVGALEPDFYREFIDRLGVDTDDWPAQSDRAQWPRLRELIASAVAARPLSEWNEVYSGTDACVTPVLSFAEAAADEHNRARGIYSEVAGALHPAPAPKFSGTPAPTPAAPNSAHLDAGELLREWERA